MFFFHRFWDRFGLDFGPFFDHIGTISASLFRASILHRFLIGFWLIFTPSDPQNMLFFIVKTTLFAKSQFHVRIDIWIDFSSILDSFWTHFWHLFLYFFDIDFCIDFGIDF